MTQGGFIYKMTFPSNHIYVGQSHFIEEDFHKKYWGSGRRCKLAVVKYGKENIKKEILQRCDSQEDLDKAEAYWIEFLHARDKTIGYNLAKGGYQVAFFDGLGHTDESKQKISAASKADWKTNPKKQNSLDALKTNAEKTRGTKRPQISAKVKESLAKIKDTSEYKAHQVKNGKQGGEALKANGGYKFTEDQKTHMSEVAKKQFARMTEEDKTDWKEKISQSLTAKKITRTKEEKAATASGRKQWIAEHREEFDLMIANRKRSARNKGKTYEFYKAETGEVIATIEHIVAFCEEHKVAPSYMYKFINKDKPLDGKIEQYEGLCIRKA